MAGPTYTFTPQTTSNKMGAVPRAANTEPIELAANGIQTQDQTASPVASPNNIPSASVTTLNVPPNAVRFHIIPLTNSINFSEQDSSVATKYATAPVGVETKIDCSRMPVIYLKANTGAANGTTFWFDMV